MVDIARVSLARIRNPTKTEAFLPDHPILTESVSELLKKKERTDEKRGVRTEFIMKRIFPSECEEFAFMKYGLQSQKKKSPGYKNRAGHKN